MSVKDDKPSGLYGGVACHSAHVVDFVHLSVSSIAPIFGRVLLAFFIYRYHCLMAERSGIIVAESVTETRCLVEEFSQTYEEPLVFIERNSECTGGSSFFIFREKELD